MHGILRPVIARVAATRLCPDLDAGLGVKPIVPRLNADLIQHWSQAKRIKLTDSGWLKVDANAQWFRIARGFKDLKGHPDLMQREPKRQPGDTTACDKNCHGRLRVCIFVAHAFACGVGVIKDRHRGEFSRRGKAEIINALKDDLVAVSKRPIILKMRRRTVAVFT